MEQGEFPMSDYWERRAELSAICVCIGIVSALPFTQWVLSANATPQAPGVELGPAHTRQADAGQIITYNHTLTNTGTTTDTFLLEVLSTQGWPVELLGGVYPSGTVLLPLQVGSQMTASFQVSLTVPLDIAGVTEITNITATSQLSPTVQDTVVDTTIVYDRTYLPLINRGYKPPIDTDHDGLADYEERVKYLTDPGLADTDGDGIFDGDWNERREYVYTVRVVMKIRQPFDIETMNDLYQDVRITDGSDQDGYTQIEAIIYPETVVDAYPSPYPLGDLPPGLQLYTQPGIATNYSPSMQSEVLQIVEGAETDVEAINQVFQWVSDETTYYLDYSIPEVYYTYLEDGEVKVRNYNGSLPVEELLQTHYFADSMFQLRTHGTCTSIATLKCAMLKAAGIPCRVIQTIFPIYYHEDQAVPYANNLNREWHCVYEQPSGQSPWWCNHAFIEVYLGERWIRADWTVNIRHEDPLCLSLKILSVSDWSEVDFSETWPVDWIHSRPYYTLLLEDQEPQH